MNNGAKLGRLPTAEIVAWPGRPLQARKRRAVVEAIVAGDDTLEKFELIERLIKSVGMTPLEFSELSLQVIEEGWGIRSTKYQRIEDRRRA
jgi:phosphopantetheine adenylyltransferase